MPSRCARSIRGSLKMSDERRRAAAPMPNELPSWKKLLPMNRRRRVPHRNHKRGCAWRDRIPGDRRGLTDRTRKIAAIGGRLLRGSAAGSIGSDLRQGALGPMQMRKRCDALRDECGEHEAQSRPARNAPRRPQPLEPRPHKPQTYRRAAKPRNGQKRKASAHRRETKARFSGRNGRSAATRAGPLTPPYIARAPAVIPGS